MATPAQGAGYYVWDPPGQSVAVYLRLDVVDRLAAEAMRAFVAVPKRGAEVGGLLLGTIQEGFPPIVRVDDFEPVACDYQRGPSYQLTEEDRAMFEATCQGWQPQASPSSYAVGYFRSHTRDGLLLDADDIELLDDLFASPAHVALLIKPYTTRVSAAGFFAREHGAFPETTPLVFPLGLRELTDEELPPGPTLPAIPTQPPPLAGDLTPPPAAELGYRGESGFTTREHIPAPQPLYPTTAAPRSRLDAGWVWIPLSFIFLLLGAVLGYQAALTLGPSATSNSGPDFALALSVTQNEDNLSLQWNRQSPAIRSARKGLLEIEDGGYTKPVELDSSQLQNGSLIYRNASNAVRFRLTVYPSARVSITETLNWKR